ncbi:MAG: glycoside hydrolase family 57 protein, partial [Gammaproteobacteria bacterium]
DTIAYLSQQYLADIVTWYHLAWMGESVRREDPRIAWLIQKGMGYTLQDRHKLLGVIGELLGGVIGRYRRLAEVGRIELSMTPYAHPILPLLIDLESAQEAMPGAPMPQLGAYPGGVERARWHIREGRAVFRHHFGLEAQGCWPSEGGVSTAALRLLSDEGFVWTASGETVLGNSLTPIKEPEKHNGKQWLYRPYLAPGTLLSCFFRDDGLSDLIGFTYATWHSHDAVNNLIHHLVNIADDCKHQPDSVVSIIMDGENAWEYYPENGYYFLSALYKRLAEHPRLELTTFSSYLEQRPATAPARLTRLVAGSWVYGTFSTWIGSADKNRGWDMLGAAKHAFDRAVAEGRLSGEQLAAAERQLGLCEGSDWFWWLGDYNPAAAVSDFERLFRLHLSNLYRMLGQTRPSELATVVSRGTGEPVSGGVMRKGQP